MSIRQSALQVLNTESDVQINVLLATHQPRSRLGLLDSPYLEHAWIALISDPTSLLLVLRRRRETIQKLAETGWVVSEGVHAVQVRCVACMRQRHDQH